MRPSRTRANETQRLEFKSHSERHVDILKWAKGWQSENLSRSAA